MTKDELKALVKRVQNGLVFTKVVATRSVKGQRGDSFAGFSAAWRNVQEDGGHNLLGGMGDGDESATVTGMTIQEAVVASVLVAREADCAAYRNAWAGGNIRKTTADEAVAIVRKNYAQMMVEVLQAMETTEVSGGGDEHNSGK